MSIEARPCGHPQTPALRVVDHLDDVDLTDPSSFVGVDLHDMWRRFRADRPVYWHPASDTCPGFWVLSRYADIVSVYRAGTSFSSAKGNMLTTLLQSRGDSAGNAMVTVADGGRHRSLRGMIRDLFKPGVLGPLAERIRKRTGARISEMVERGSFDFAKDVAESIPIGTVCDLLGVPAAEDTERLLHWSKRVLSSDTGKFSQAETLAARGEILGFLADLVASRRRAPAEGDAISYMINAVSDDGPLSDDEIVLNCYSFIVGGDESSRLTSTTGVLAFIQHPDEWRALKNGDVNLDEAVEEVVRWSTPAMHFARTATADAWIGGQRVRAGDIVTIWNTSANQDEDVFAEPGRFDIARRPNPHVGFGYGPHYCVGASLARIQLAALLDALRRHVDEMESRGPAKQIHSNFLFGYSSLPVAFTPEGA
ncbi:cytochrome P450 [Microbispora sp. H10670]|uniref:cytochrome P450 n=1 Tax=Microbispora sp. H10670 TaxID=2729108 RepID=UPI001C720E97|nr:cytochrome P450 [Microbispora sp. H10670]